ncbi:hypothetical protein EV361DRAFT_871366 [Lentinula raphanica]|nr:hypothetical protein EV361DRAFT_871366 [Lentinula raphanica]
MTSLTRAQKPLPLLSTPTPTDPTQPTQTPQNWCSLPIYTALLNKLSNGDPSNDDFFRTPFESDPRSPGSSGGGTQLRFGGDLQGLGSDRVLDYPEGMGVGVTYVAGTGFLNEIWEADRYSLLNYSVLDRHWGTWEAWVTVIDKIHTRGLYFMADFTVGTTSDSIGFKGAEVEYLNPSYIPWNFTDYKDFESPNTRDTSCVLPQFWNDDSTLLANVSSQAPPPAVSNPISTNTAPSKPSASSPTGNASSPNSPNCMVIQPLDIDTIHVDKSLQVTVDALAEWSKGTRECAKGVGKGNFHVLDLSTPHFVLGRGRKPARCVRSLAMPSSLAWLHHECYHLGSQQYFNIPLSRALLGCSNPSVPLDHLNDLGGVSGDSRDRVILLMFLRSKYAVLKDGFALTQRRNWMDVIETPGSGGVGNYIVNLGMRKRPEVESKCQSIQANEHDQSTTDTWLTTETIHKCQALKREKLQATKQVASDEVQAAKFASAKTSGKAPLA